jgi:hypothetical protein
MPVYNAEGEHVSPKMLAHYSHVRMETRRKVLDALCSGGSRDSYGTNYDTNSATQNTKQPQLIEKTGGADGIVSGSLKKTQEKPLNLRTYCHLLILALSVSSPREPFGPSHIARRGQQLATVISRC